MSTTNLTNMSITDTIYEIPSKVCKYYENACTVSPIKHDENDLKHDVALQTQCDNKMSVGAQQNGRVFIEHAVGDHDSSADSVSKRNCKNIEDSSVKVYQCNNVQDIGETELQRFYKGKNIFVTGGTGFMGKILIDKLLRSCPGVENIYLLVRQKKGKDVHSRIEEIFDDPVFERLKSEVPKFRHKIVTIPGDCGMAGLGLNITDREMLTSKVDLVFHAAATVRFDEKLRTALAINVHGVRDMMALCKNMRNLKALIHVSTAYSNCNLDHVEEKFYICPVKHQELEAMVDKLDDNQLEEMLPTILGNWPNTYAFTKALAENVVREQSEGLNMGIFRPAIVTSTSAEPVVGWIDNLYGPTGVVAGACTGVLRTLHCDSEINANIVPVDLCVNALLTSAWDVANNAAERKGEDMLIYNYVSSVENPITWEDFMQLNMEHGFSHPFSCAIWYISFRMQKSAAINKLYMLVLHLLPAMLIDGLALCVGQKPRLLEDYRKIHKFSKVISYFCTREIQFSNSNVQTLWTKLDKEDQKTFYFSMTNLQWKDYFQNYIQGMRKYLFKDDESTLESARRKWKRFYYLHQLVKLTFISLFLYAGWMLLGKFILRILL